MEYLASDVKNIKDSLHRMEKYIKGKSIDNSNSNNVKNLEGIGKVVWKFLSFIYDLHQDGLYVDNSNTTFKNKVKSKFIPQVPKTLTNNKGKKIVKLIFVSSLPPLIPAKSQKEVNELSKYFKKNTNILQKKSYIQVLSSSKQSDFSFTINIALEKLKIKKTFPNLLNKKIELVQKVINSLKNKPKPKINMTTKDLS